MAKQTLKLLDASGHTTIEYDLDTGEAVQEAEAALSNAVTASRASVFNASTKEKVPPKLGTADELIVVPQMAGGA